MHQHFNVIIHYKNATNNRIWNYTNLLHMVIVNLLHVSVTFCGNLEGGIFSKDMLKENGFGGLGVACWPLIPKFADSNPAEAVEFLGGKNPQHAFLQRGSKAVGPMSYICGM